METTVPARRVRRMVGSLTCGQKGFDLRRLWTNPGAPETLRESKASGTLYRTHAYDENRQALGVEVSDDCGIRCQERLH